MEPISEEDLRQGFIKDVDNYIAHQKRLPRWTMREWTDRAEAIITAHQTICFVKNPDTRHDVFSPEARSLFTQGIGSRHTNKARELEIFFHNQGSLYERRIQWFLASWNPGKREPLKKKAQEEAGSKPMEMTAPQFQRAP